MQLITEGSVVKLSDNRNYVAFAVIENEGRSFVYLMSAEQPVEMVFMEQTLEEGALKMRTLMDKSEKEQALKLFTRVKGVGA